MEATDTVRLALGALVLTAVWGCGSAPEVPTPDPTATATIDLGPPIFAEVATQVGLVFEHHNGARGEFNYPELMTGGGALLDYDGDGDLDIYLVQSGVLPSNDDASLHNRLFRNLGDGTFEDVTAAAGVGDATYGVGAAAADYDGDGRVDLYVTNLGPNRLFRNAGDGSFTDVTERAGVGATDFSSSAVFVDYDADGDLDLFVANYVRWSPALEKRCVGRNGLRGYCSPSEYAPEPDTLYRNDGDGSFTDVSAASGIGEHPGPGLGVTTADFDGDGRVDIYVANDQAANHLWINQGGGRFVEEGLIRGAGLNELGAPEAGMGVMATDPDGDGDWDLWLVHLSGETNTFYRNDGGHFRDVTDSLHLGGVSQPYTGFGTAMFDFDNDTILDIFIANGKVKPGETAEFDYREPNQLLRGLTAGGFEDVSARGGEALALNEISRGAAFGDLDNDGDLDVLVINNGGPARLLRNDSSTASHWLTVDVCGGRDAGRHAVGAVVTVEAGGRRQIRQVQPGYSFTVTNDPRVHFGLGSDNRVDRVEVRWPDGETSEFMEVEIDTFLTATPGGLHREAVCDG